MTFHSESLRFSRHAQDRIAERMRASLSDVVEMIRGEVDRGALTKKPPKWAAMSRLAVQSTVSSRNTRWARIEDTDGTPAVALLSIDGYPPRVVTVYTRSNSTPFRGVRADATRRKFRDRRS